MVSQKELQALLERVAKWAEIPTTQTPGHTHYLKLDKHDGYLIRLVETATESDSAAFNHNYYRKTANEMQEYLSGILIGIDIMNNLRRC